MTADYITRNMKDKFCEEKTEKGQGRILAGPAGWSYPDWEGLVYPPGVSRRGESLAYILDRFPLVEVNTSFYHLPGPAMVERWSRVATLRPGRRMVLKAPREYSHTAGPIPPGEPLREVANILAGSGVLGCILLQFPWSFRCVDASKIRLRKVLDALEGFPVAVEVRHGSWDLPAFRDYLGKRGVALCNVDQPVIGESLPLTAHVTASFAYLRLHGRNRENWFRDGAGRDARYDYLYDAREIAEIGAVARSLARKAEVVYVVTNNHYRGKAVVNAAQLERMLDPDYSVPDDFPMGPIP